MENKHQLYNHNYEYLNIYWGKCSVGKMYDSLKPYNKEVYPDIGV